MQVAIGSFGGISFVAKSCARVNELCNLFQVAEISWKHDMFKNIIFRMVAFIAYHTITFDNSYIDRREEVSRCCPPRPVCMAGVISEGYITDVMEGHKYNRVARLHKIV